MWELYELKESSLQAKLENGVEGSQNTQLQGTI
jgi:hypothetical protein